MPVYPAFQCTRKTIPSGTRICIKPTFHSKTFTWHQVHFFWTSVLLFYSKMFVFFCLFSNSRVFLKSKTFPIKNKNSWFLCFIRQFPFRFNTLNAWSGSTHWTDHNVSISFTTKCREFSADEIDCQTHARHDRHGGTTDQNPQVRELYSFQSVIKRWRWIISTKWLLLQWIPKSGIQEIVLKTWIQLTSTLNEWLSIISKLYHW